MTLPCSCLIKELLYFHGVVSNIISNEIFGKDFSEDLEWKHLKPVLTTEGKFHLKY